MTITEITFACGFIATASGAVCAFIGMTRTLVPAVKDFAVAIRDLCERLRCHTAAIDQHTIAVNAATDKAATDCTKPATDVVLPADPRWEGRVSGAVGFDEARRAFAVGEILPPVTSSPAAKIVSETPASVTVEAEAAIKPKRKKQGKRPNAI